MDSAAAHFLCALQFGAGFAGYCFQLDRKSQMGDDSSQQARGAGARLLLVLRVSLSIELDFGVLSDRIWETNHKGSQWGSTPKSIFSLYEF